MEDSKLLNIALVAAVFGLIALFLIMYFSFIPEKNLNELADSDLGQKIKTSGTINEIRISPSNKTTFVKLDQRCSLELIIFDRIDLNDLKRGDNVSVEGVVQEYSGKKEIVVDSIQRKGVKK